MKGLRLSLMFLAVGAISLALAGCGGGGGSLATRSSSLSGTVMVPSGTPTRGIGFRANSTHVPLPGATVNLYDVTQSGSNAISGPPVATTTTDSNGNYQFQNVPAGHNFIVEANKTATSNGTPTTITVATNASTNSSGSSGSATADADESTTLAVGYLLQQLQANMASGTANLGNLVSQFIQQLKAQEQAGHGPNIDLTKKLTDQESVAEQVEQEDMQSLAPGAYVSEPPSQAASDDENEGKAVHALVETVLDSSHSTVKGVLVLADSSGHVTDADNFSASLQTDGTFTATTADGGYTVSGSVDGEEMHGHWAAANGQMDGHWEATHTQQSEMNSATGSSSNSGSGPTPPPPPGGSNSGTGSSGTQTGSQSSGGTQSGSGSGSPGYAYVGTFSAQASGSSSSGPNGTWFLAVFPNQEVLLYAHDDSDASLPHNQKVVVAFGNVSSGGTFSFTPVFPLATGGTSTSSVTFSGALGQTTLQGSWTCSGLVAGNVFNGSGTWTATLF